ncbi:MAG: proline racemase family protein [Chloroflexota bacterium]|nr:proline racemase family protein [Chloroflexota bacterium]
MRFDRLLSCVDAHAAGEPLRIIMSGMPQLRGETILARRKDMREHHDQIRRQLLFEPRGHADMYGAVLTPPVSAGADFGVIFLTNEGYSTMCGHGVIALTTVLLETGVMPRVAPETEIVYDSPAGLIRARAGIEGDRVTGIAFANVPAFRFAQGVEVETSRGGQCVDVAFGGAWYAIVAAENLGLKVEPAQVTDLIQLGMEIKRAVDLQLNTRHPLEPTIVGIYGTIITGPPLRDGAQGRNVTIYAEGAVDRSPCGTGTSARLACLFADGEIGLNEPYVHESIIDTTFSGSVLETATVGGIPAVVTEIRGRGFLTGFHQFVIDPADPVRDGFLVR